MTRPIDLTNRRFGRLVVLKRVENTRFNKTQWLCKCDCGKEIIAIGGNLIQKKQFSCGCQRRQEASIRAYNRRTHEMSDTRLYRIWHGIKTRCYKKNDPNYKHYGSRGIEMCDEWKNDFMPFYNWAMKNGYEPNAKRGITTIDRIDVNGNYCPENCRWITLSEQGNNKTTSRYMVVNGVKHTISEWSKITGIEKSTLKDRANRGDTGERFIRPVDKSCWTKAYKEKHKEELGL